ncbi:MAG: PAS domain S-box protein, partial [Deltaproteobacteria bacterium]
MASNSGPDEKHDVPLYNSRLIKNYVEYCTIFHPELDIDSLLSYAGIAVYELEDQGHWFSQRQVDRFHQILAQEAGDPNISREVGRYAPSSKASGVVRQYALGFMSPAAVYWVAQSLGSRLTRAHTFKTRKLGANKIEVFSSPNPGIAEKPFQCDNRMGMFEAMAKLFTNKFAKVEHPTCIHEGGDICRYIITWEKTRALMWRRVRNYLIFLSPLVCAALHFFIPFISLTILILLFTSLVLGISFYSGHLENRELTETIETQSNAAEGQLDEMNIRYNNALLIQEIGQATSTILDRDKLLNTVVGIMEKRLDFDRGMIMLANEDKTRLVHTAGYGYSKEHEKLLQRTEFHLDNPESKGMFVVAFKDQKPFLLNDLAEDSKKLSERSQELAKQMEVHSLICVPIVYEQETLGILAVDNIKSKRPLTQSDMSLLQGVASQTAVSMVNAISFNKLQESEEKYRTIIESTEEGYFEIDLAGNLTFFNEPLCKISGYSQGELKGMNYRDYATPETAERMYQVFNEIYRTKKPARVMDYEVIRRDGSAIVLGMSASLIQDATGEPIGFRGVVRDVT